MGAVSIPVSTQSGIFRGWSQAMITPQARSFQSAVTGCCNSETAVLELGVSKRCNHGKRSSGTVRKDAVRGLVRTESGVLAQVCAGRLAPWLAPVDGENRICRPSLNRWA